MLPPHDGMSCGENKAHNADDSEFDAFVKKEGM